MSKPLKISLDNIAGIIPQSSTYSDVLKLLGSKYEVKYLPEEQLERNLILAKIILRYTELGITVTFLDPGSDLPLEAPVTVVGVEGPPLRSEDGLYVGMPMDEADKIISAGYNILKRDSWFIDFTSQYRSKETLMTVFEEDGKVRFIKLFIEDRNN